MNERIYELIRQSAVSADQAGDYALDKGLVEPTEKLDVAKFAELIVEECCQVLSKETIRHDGYGYNQHALYQKIREHFGVEQ
jgi:hypothetical protein